MNIKQVLLC